MKKKTLPHLPISAIDRQKANDIHAYIIENYKTVTRSVLCKRFGVDKNFFSDCFTPIHQKTFLQVRTEQRMTVALVLLQSNTPEKKIASDLGFTSAPVFIKAFRKYYKCSPGEWLERKRTKG